MKKALSLLLVLVMLCSMVPMTAFAAETDNLTHATPESQGVANAIARAYLLTDITWTPIANVPGVDLVDGEWIYKEFEAGKTYQGIPYSGVIATDTYVGLNVSLDSFLTAVADEDSLLYTRNLYSDSYPKAATYYGTVCSKYAQYVLDIPGSYNTNNIPNIPGMDTIAMPGQYTVNQIKLGDIVVDTSYHTAVCTDILYHSDGSIAYIEISEAMPPTVRRLLWSPDEFYAEFATYRLCRYQYIDSVPAAPNWGCEETGYALMPRQGDKYNYPVSTKSAVVDILKTGYSKAVVLRDGVIVDEIPVDDTTETISFDRSIPGNVEIYLEKADGTRSSSVYACVVESSVTVTDSSQFTSGKLTVSFSGSSGTPLYVQVGSAHAIFCNVEDETGTAEIIFPFAMVSGKTVRVAYQNEYGIYLSPWSSFTTAPNTSTDPYLSQAEYWDGYTLTPSSSTPVVQDGKTGYWTYTMIPVEENTTYFSEGSNRMWFFDKDGNAISTFNSNKDSDVRFQFTTPEGTAFVSISYAPDDVQKGTETMIAVTSGGDGSDDTEVPETDPYLSLGEYWNGYTLTPDSSTPIIQSNKAGYWTYTMVPVDENATYFSEGANRMWFFDADGNAISTYNAYTQSDVPFQFTTPLGTAYVSISYAPELVEQGTETLVHVHTYENGTCTACGAGHPNLANYEGKVISILSASTSTFAGYIPVADGFNLAHRARYPQDNLLTDVSDTWWMQLIHELDAKLGINDSWAGSQVLNTQDTNSGDLGPDAAMASLTRIQNLGANGTPDMILVFAGGNDMGRGVPLGTFDPETAPTQVDLTSYKWNSFADAYVTMIMRLQHYYPDSQIVVMTSYAMPSYVTAAKLDKYGPVVQAICDHYGVPYIQLRDCGVTFDMLPDKIHPNAEGMDYITRHVYDSLLEMVEMEPGENIVYSVTHHLSNVQASLGHYKGVSAGKPFTETLTGDDLTVTVTMGGKDITADVYKDGKIAIPEVTGDLVINAKAAFNADGHLQQLPENVCAGMNLWTALEPEKIYYTATGWGNTAAGNSWSVTFPVEPGERVWATSFGAYPDNGSTANGVRITWFDENGMLETLDRNTVYNEFKEKGYITVPQGATALNVPMTGNEPNYAVYLLDREHDCKSVVTAPTCTEGGYTTYTCGTCGHNYVSDEVAAAGHKYNAVVTAPTCTEDGYTTYTCSACGHSNIGDEVAAVGHKYDAVVTAPTCTEGGYTTYTCSVCGDRYVGDEVAAVGHKYNAELIMPTCTEGGHTVYTCVCGERYIGDEVPAKGHTPADAVKENETETGYDEVVCCAVCAEELSREHIQTYVPGDINGDGVVNNKDVIRLFQYLSDWDVEVEEAALDVNGDGAVNNKDVIRLFQYLSDWDVEIY